MVKAGGVKAGGVKADGVKAGGAGAGGIKAGELVLRIVAGLICAVMVLFVRAQNDDPDALLWVAIYGLPALLAGLTAWRPAIVYGPIGRRVLVAALMLAVGGMVYYWPTVPGFWRIEVWWEDEAVREGMGIMIVVVSLIVLALPLLWREA